MIVSASRRTDLPAYYGEWLLNRLKAGYVLVRNPMNHSQVSQIVLSPDFVDCIVFWTKDPQNLVQYLPLIDEMGYSYYFQFTLTPYGPDLERNLRDKAELIHTFAALSQRIGKSKVVWRYDPIILSDRLDLNYHTEHFFRLCEALHPYTNTVVISFVDRYAKLKTDLIRGISATEMAEAGERLGQIARQYGLRIQACCEDMDLSAYGIERSSCIDQNLIEDILGYKIEAKPDRNQRNGCGCIESVDIGAYHTCQNGCIYCYANCSPQSVEENCRRHSKTGEFLVGQRELYDKVTVRKAASWKRNQLEFFK